MSDSSLLPLHLALMDETARLCAEKGIRHVIVSPGSRSAPLTVSLARQPELRCRMVYDERSAAYIGLGLAQQTGQPVALVCTSGTAALNYAPAVVEAFYQQAPLLVFTADRPPEWIDQQDNQAIHQRGLYEPHCRGSFELPVDISHPDARWFALRTLSEAIERTQQPIPGPVHVNVPLREPLYAPLASGGAPMAAVQRIDRLPALPWLAANAWEQLIEDWQRAHRKLVVVGLHPAHPRLAAAMTALSARPDVAVVAEITANLYPEGTPLHHADMALALGDQTALAELQPDLVVSCGGPLVSKALKSFLRRHPPQAQWHVQPAGEAPDTFQRLTQVIPLRPADFFAELAQRTPPGRDAGYAAAWRRLEGRAAASLASFLVQAAFGEFQAVYHVMRSLPAGSRLQLGNSMAIRYANLIGHAPGVSLGSVNANRGVSGIDGTVSTAVGAALADDRLTTLITGDLGFFYDRNGLWHRHVPANLRLVVLNNHGGGIFDIIDGPNRLPRSLQEEYFLTPHQLTAERTAVDHGLDYFFAADAASLQAALAAFFMPGPRAALLEIETDMAVNTQVFQLFKNSCSTAPLG
jgi:2-succinyl-5-enolpyruvyl-6-hydroxy-3-cyclohexene-1-carboxylate synthase